MHLISTIFIGFIAGMLAKLLRPGRDPKGFLVTALIGIAGSVIATYGGQAVGIYAAGQPAGFIGAVIGAIVVLVIFHRLRPAE